MEKINWLKDRLEQNPGDPMGWYWLGLEYADAGHTRDAISSLTEGLKYCEDEELKLKIIDAVNRLTQEQLEQESPSYDESPRHSEDLEVEEGPDNSSDTSDSPSVVKQRIDNAAPHLQVIDGGSGAAGNNHAADSEETIRFDDVGGLDELKKTISMKIIKPFFNQGLFSKFRKKSGGGVLLYGPPGCGKTFMARATAGECQARFINVHITDILDPYMGVSEQNLRRLFETARAHKPSVLFFDEVDAIGYNRAKSSSSVRFLIDLLLSELEGLDSDNNQILVIGATNMPWDVDPALKRPGRFDRMIFVPPPDEKAREAIFRLKLKGRPVGDIDYKALASKTTLFSGADIENVVERAAENVLEEILETDQERPIETGDLLHALQDVQPSTLEWMRTIKNYVKYANQSGLYNDVDTFLRRHKKWL